MTEETATIGERLKAARRRAVLSQAELAARAGVPRLTVARWETGKLQRDPHARTVRKVAAALGVDAGWLLTGEGRMDPAATGLGGFRPGYFKVADVPGTGETRQVRVRVSDVPQHGPSGPIRRVKPDGTPAEPAPETRTKLGPAATKRARTVAARQATEPPAE